MARRTRRPRAARQAGSPRAGRPKRVCLFCGAPALGGHVNRKLDLRCGEHGWLWRQHADHSPVPRAIVVDEIAKLTALLATLPADAVAADQFPSPRALAEAFPEAPEPEPEAEAAAAPPPAIDAVTGTPLPAASPADRF